MEPLSSGGGSGSGSESGQTHLSVQQALDLVQSADVASRIRAAQEIRRLTKTSQRCRRHLAASISPLVDMLRLPDSVEANEAALLALVNLAVTDENLWDGDTTPPQPKPGMNRPCITYERKKKNV